MTWDLLPGLVIAVSLASGLPIRRLEMPKGDAAADFQPDAGNLVA